MILGTDVKFESHHIILQFLCLVGIEGAKLRCFKFKFANCCEVDMVPQIQVAERL